MERILESHRTRAQSAFEPSIRHKSDWKLSKIFEPQNILSRWTPQVADRERCVHDLLQRVDAYARKRVGNTPSWRERERERAALCEL